MSKILFFLLIGGGVYLWLRSKRPSSPSSAKPKSAEDMVRCAHCGVHLPRSEAIGSEAAWFCSNAHQSEHRG
ncbi:PP0621 family protein [Sulfuriferula thiophila]|uniref:PP0621 family protein n=1 Tax=Sulfuriferula thiophila TaxID=1781211 RepID=UPI000F60B730|nr:PP0621 family protein [Sulfuriferula thiophila]